MSIERCNLCSSDKVEQFLTNQNKSEAPCLIKCASCGLIFLSPMPLEEEIPSYYNTEYKPCEMSRPRVRQGVNKLLFEIKERIEKAILEDFFGYPRSSPNFIISVLRKMILLPFYLRFIAIGKNLDIIPYLGTGRFLDIGFGNATALLKFRKKGWNVYGIDSEQRVVDDARNRFGLNVTTCDFKDYDCESEYFNAIYMSHLLEHIPDPKTVLSKVYCLLKREGTLLLKVPNINSFESKILKDKWPFLDMQRHLYQFSPKTIKAFLKNAGFRKISIKFELWHMDLLKNILKHRFNIDIIDNKFTQKISKCLSFILGYLGLGRIMVIFSEK